MDGGVRLLEGDGLVIINLGEIKVKYEIPCKINTDTAEKGDPHGQT